MTTAESLTGTADPIGQDHPSDGDPFDTAALRRQVLLTWAASPARFREDANAEDDAASAHRGRLLDELLQNAADAASEGAGPDITGGGRVLVRLRPGVLEVANTGRPLTRDGVVALSTLRASAKRDATGSVGRFGVGFAAVLAVTDNPSIVSRTSGGVRWSRAETVAAVAGIAELGAERARRGASVPVLRLPHPLPPDAQGDVPPGYETLVRLSLRNQDEEQAVAELMAAFDPTLLLALPALDTVRIERPGLPPRVVSCIRNSTDAILDVDGQRRTWVGARQEVDLPEELLAERPVEERGRRHAAVSAFRPADGAENGWPAGVAQVFRSPQPTDDPLSLPIVLVVPLPVDTGRRRVQPGPLTEFLLNRAADAVRDLAVRTTDLALVPVGLPAGPLDAELAARLHRLLPAAPVLPGNKSPATALLLDLDPAARVALPRLVDVLAPIVPDLLPAELAEPRYAAALRVLRVRRVSLAGVVDLLSSLQRPAIWWDRLYAALHPALAWAAAREELGALPVPLANGRMVTGARGLLLPASELASDSVAGLPIRLVHPDVADQRSRELLQALGAVEATARELLDDRALLEPEVDPDSVLALVAAAGAGPGDVPALGRLLLPTETGEEEPAADLLLPGGPLDRLVLPESPFVRVDPELARRWPGEALEAVGVLRTFSVLSARDVPLLEDEPLLLDLDDSDRWIAETAPPELAEEFVAVRDLELVRYPDALAELARSPLREVALGSGYTRWWLSAHPVLEGCVPRDCALPGSELDGLYDPAPPFDGVDEEFLVGIGCRRSWADVARDPSDAFALLDRLGDARRRISWPMARRGYLAVAAALRDVADADLDEPPESVRTPRGVVARRTAVVLDRPDLERLLGSRPVLRVPARAAPDVARVLDLPLASTLARFEVVRREPLTVSDVDGRPVEVPWFGGLTDPRAGAEAQARAIAWRDDRWGDRHRIEAELRAEGDRAATLLAENDFDEPG